MGVYFLPVEHKRWETGDCQTPAEVAAFGFFLYWCVRTDHACVSPMHPVGFRPYPTGPPRGGYGPQQREAGGSPGSTGARYRGRDRSKEDVSLTPRELQVRSPQQSVKRQKQRKENLRKCSQDQNPLKHLRDRKCGIRALQQQAHRVQLPPSPPLPPQTPPCRAEAGGGKIRGCGGEAGRETFLSAPGSHWEHGAPATLKVATRILFCNFA